MKDIKSILKLILGLPICVISAAIITMNPLAIIPCYIGYQMAVDGVSGNYIKKNCFMINKHSKLKLKDRKVKVHMINQNITRIERTLALLFKKDKGANFLKETYNLFEQLPQSSKNGIIKYGCTSHVLTLRNLKTLQKEGYIQNLEYHQKKKKSRLILEELAMGKKPSFKKRPKYNICFELTDKKLLKEDFDKLVSIDSSEKENINKTNQNLIKQENINPTKESNIKESIVNENISQDSLKQDIINNVEENNTQEIVEKKEEIKVADEEVEKLRKFVSELPPDVEITEEMIREICDSNEIQDEELQNSKNI